MMSKEWKDDYNRRYYLKYRDKLIASRRKYREEHYEEILAFQRSEEVCKHSREYNKAHPERGVAKNSVRRALKKGNGGKFTPKEWKALLDKYEYTCLCCGRDDVKLTADHVIPIAMGGTSDISNIQPLCKSCNSKKYTRYADYRKEAN